MTPIEKEIHKLLSSHYTEYQERTYLTPSWYSSTIRKEPENYPILSSMPMNIARRNISLFLKNQGRVRRNMKGVTRGACWMLPEACVQ